jgi:hypothetical protein
VRALRFTVESDGLDLPGAVTTWDTCPFFRR